MRPIARPARRALSEGRRGRVGRVVGFSGMGGRRVGEALLVTEDGVEHGSLLGPLGRPLLDEPLPAGGSALFDLVLGDEEAVSAGLACGGRAQVLVSDLGAVPAEAWAALVAGEPVALVSRLSEPGTLAVLDQPAGRRRAVLGSLGQAATDEAAVEMAVAALRAGRDSVRVLTDEPLGPAVLEVLMPATTLHVLGTGELVDALAAQAALLGWSFASHSSYGQEMATALGSLARADALVVLSHDHDIATPALAAGLRAGCYVGALGSRHTQEERRRRLEAAGLAPEALGRLHGPVGLDLGARSPEETALAIAAEILAVRAGRLGESLSATSGPING